MHWRHFGRLFWILLCVLVALAPLPVVAQRATPPASAEIALAELPAEARHTLALIKRGGPYPFQRDGVVFGNHERMLPARQRGYYREFTVPTPGANNRGARRIIAGGGQEYFYTADHYRSFRRIRE
jgi:ribonuclease T1